MVGGTFAAGHLLRRHKTRRDVGFTRDVLRVAGMISWIILAEEYRIVLHRPTSPRATPVVVDRDNPIEEARVPENTIQLNMNAV
jgi:hypothetical protein